MPRRLALLTLALAVLGAGRAAAQDAYRDRALRILRSVPLIDGHNDLPGEIRGRGGLDSVDIAVSQPALHTDIARLRAGGVGAQFWAAYVPSSTMQSGTHPAVYALEQIALIHRLCAKYPDTFASARTVAEIERNFKARRISCLIGIEGGHALESSLGALRAFADMGVRYVTLTHWATTDWADAATDSARHGGLTAFGEEVVREMNRLGVMVDLSHVSDGTMMDALRVSAAPVMYSHSSARALAAHPRNVPDSILALVGRQGGVVMVNFAPFFISEEARRYDEEWGFAGPHVRELLAAGADSAAVRDSLRLWGGRAPRATLAQVADHVEHIWRVCGIGCVGLGSDFDGISSTPVGLEDVSKFPDLLAELLRRGWTDADVRKAVGENVLRVMRRVEEVAREMRRQG
jgi:membrane dipeptidase